MNENFSDRVGPRLLAHSPGTLGADITLTSALPGITSEIVLEGANYAIDGGNSVRIFHVAYGGDFTVNQPTLQKGTTAGNGGAIWSRGGLTVTNTDISGNTASSGGAILNDTADATVTVTNSTLSGNAANAGGAIGSYGSLTVDNSTFSGNAAGGGGHHRHPRRHGDNDQQYLLRQYRFHRRRCLMQQHAASGRQYLCGRLKCRQLFHRRSSRTTSRSRSTLRPWKIRQTPSRSKAAVFCNSKAA